MSTDMPSADSNSPPLPEIRGYRLARVINHGSMSIVYLGEQIALSREVAIKVMLPQALSDEVSRRRFENEVRTIARLEHPHVVRIHELGRTEDGLPYYSMPFLARGHLGQRSYRNADGRTDEARVIEILRALLSAIEYAHGRGVVHRDVKAENVLFDDTEQPLLADFGIALRRGFGPRVTAIGLAVGSTAYMAPEQARGEHVDGRADLYSLGVVVWELLTGHLPFQAADALSMAVMHAQNPIPKLPASLHRWQRFMKRALAKLPDERFDDVAQMREALDRVERKRRPRLLAPAHALLAARRNRAAAETARNNVDASARVPRWPKIVGVVLAAGTMAMLVVLGPWFGANTGGDRFFRVADPESTANQAPIDLTRSMLRPLPEGPVTATLEDARRQIATQKLTEPEGDNAFASVVAAWRSAPGDPAVAKAIQQLTAALTAVMLGHMQDGNAAGAREYFEHASRLGRATTSTDSAAQVRMRESAAAVLRERIDRAAADFDRKRARNVADSARELGLPKPMVADLVAQAAAIPRRGEVLPGDPAGAVLGVGGVAISQRPVSRGDYARFASATDREAARCRNSASLLRVLDPRSWREPGFTQAAAAPVVCVSLADAKAYAQWFSARTSHDYRLPSRAESQQTAPEIIGQKVSLWLSDCGADCQRHLVGGSSWHESESRRPLATDRGYDDVGFRLLREL